MSRQINIAVEDKVYSRLTEMARERGYTPSAYAKMLFDAAYAARAGKSGDMELDALVGCVMVLWGSRRDTAQIAAALKITESTVVKIIGAWRSRMMEAA